MLQKFLDLKQSGAEVLKTAQKILYRKKRWGFLLRLFLNLFFAALNIAILTISIVALVKVLEIYQTHRHYDFVSKILPMILVSSLSLLVFIFSLILSIYSNVNKIDSYKAAYEKVLYYFVHYQSKANTWTAAELEAALNAIKQELKTTRKKSQFTKALQQSLVPGN